jgi:hypothetical protein
VTEVPEKAILRYVTVYKKVYLQSAVREDTGILVTLGIHTRLINWERKERCIGRLTNKMLE